MIDVLEFSLSFEGNSADEHQLDFYDVAQAIAGFQRSLALTTHLVLTGNIITQAPSLKAAQILALPPEEGSWKIKAAVVLTAAYHVLTLPHDTPLGHLVYSSYDYVVKETLGFHVDYDKSLGRSYDEIRRRYGEDSNVPILQQSQLDSVLEKCEPSIRSMHRPIHASKTAIEAKISCTLPRGERLVGEPLTDETFEYLEYTRSSDDIENVLGKVSSYNINTFKGRLFLYDEGRPIPFIISDTARTANTVNKIVESLKQNAVNRNSAVGNISCRAIKYFSRTGRLKRILITEVQ